MSSKPKKSKTYHFNEEWELDYFFTMVNDKCRCLICLTSIAIAKKGNLERHFLALHNKYQTDYPPNSELRKHKVRGLKTQLTNQQNVFKKPMLKSQAVTTASFKVSYLLAKNCKPFSDGEFVKEIFLEMSDSLFNDFKNKSEIIAAIQDLQLSRNTVMRRIEKMSGNVKEQLYNDINRCSCFSLQCDESTDISDTAQLLVSIRMVFKDFTCKEELLGMIFLKERTRGVDIFKAFKNLLNDLKVPLFKLVSITTDGAAAMIVHINGFITLCQNEDKFPAFSSYHCIIHQQETKHKRELQGKNKTVIDMISCIDAYKTKFILLIEDLQQNNLNHFPNMVDNIQKHKNINYKIDKYITEIQKVIEDFEIRFQDFENIKEIVEFISFPFKKDLSVKRISQKISDIFHMEQKALENEIIILQTDLILQARKFEENFWKYIKREKYPSITKCSKYIYSCFGSTYLCESAFSYLKLTKTKQRSVLTDSHTEDSLLLSLSGYTPNYDFLVRDMQTQSSH
ncbi:general transcription factor II-I repeat domain-containing protein 2-like [Centruroides vittatus]|uniref:general transcription factor II-I repeat domain-containing protein 2-like n=1 Tax=Centruroides vittatus TaxID=120091 RepID=UPI00350EFD99